MLLLKRSSISDCQVNKETAENEGMADVPNVNKDHPQGIDEVSKCILLHWLFMCSSFESIFQFTTLSEDIVVSFFVFFSRAQ